MSLPPIPTIKFLIIGTLFLPYRDAFNSVKIAPSWPNEKERSITPTKEAFDKALPKASEGKGLKILNLINPTLIPFFLKVSTVSLIVPEAAPEIIRIISASSVLYSSRGQYISSNSL